MSDQACDEMVRARRGEAYRHGNKSSRVVRASQHQINLLAPRSKSLVQAWGCASTVEYVLEWDHYTCLRHCRPSASQRWRATTCTKRRHYCYLRSIAFQTWQRPLRRIALPSRFTQAKTLVQRVRRERRLFLACLSRGTYCTSADRPGAHSSRMRMQGVVA